MRFKAIFITLIFLLSFSAADSQEQPERFFLAGEKLSERAVKKVFPKTPDSFRATDAKGRITVWIDVTEKGEVESARMGSFFEPVRNYVEDAVKRWEFKPLKKHGKAVPFKGLLVLYLDYGGFITEKPPSY